ncbi:MAG: glycosyltransferase [Lachnospiraceae bacterium]|nr:glycosyltransferase [Lachnospiraceae bacterium]
MAENQGRKRVMLIVPMLDQGGLERVCAATAQLLKTEYEVHLVVFNTAGMIYDVSGVDLTDLNLGAVEGKIGKLINVQKRVRRVRQLKKKWDIQLSYSFGPTANLVNVLSKHHDFIWAGIRGYGALSDKRSMKLVCRMADRVVSCTKVMEQEICMQFAPRQSAVLYNPCDLAQIQTLAAQETSKEFDSFFEREGKIVVSMGRDHDVKGFWHLLKAVSLVKKELPSLKLMIIGAGDYSEYKTLAEQLGMGDDILFTGVQTNPFALLARSDVYALTSESEGFPNALIEAMAAGLPCISVNCLTGPAEILHNEYQQCDDRNKTFYADYGVLTGIFHGSKDMNPANITEEEKSFAQELKKLLTDDKQYQCCKDAAKGRAQQFSMENYLKELKKLIETDTAQ